MATQNERAWTVSRIATHLDAPVHRIKYVIDSRGITPADRVGIARVFDRRAVDRIAHELRRIEHDAGRESRKAVVHE